MVNLCDGEYCTGSNLRIASTGEGVPHYTVQRLPEMFTLFRHGSCLTG